MKVKAKKYLGQHFLHNLMIAERIVNSLTFEHYDSVLEIGPGMGVLTKLLLQNEKINLSVVELDEESVEFLKVHFPELENRIYHRDFLKMPLEEYFTDNLCIIGNFPYNISSQILFRVLDFKDEIPEVVGMFQREVAQRICAKPGSKTYGILSVLLQAFYSTEYLFTVSEGAFNPPPKVKSGVIRLKRNEIKQLSVDEKLFKQVVKTAFNQRRKTLRNALKSFTFTTEAEKYFPLRAEQLSVENFIELTGFVAVEA